jgi:hypothetical protein
MDRKLPQYLLGKYHLIGTVTFSVLFALVYLNISIPFSDTAWFGLGDSTMFMFTLVFVAIAVLTLIVSRMFMYKSKSIFELTYFTYCLWCITEILVISGLYTWITIEVINTDESVLETLRKSLTNGFIALGIPYIISGMYFAIIDKNNTIRLMNYENVVTDEPHKAESSLKKITLFDNSGTLKLSVSPENLYYIESDDNYIKVWYTDSRGQLQNYMLRCRLKTVEDSFKDSGLIRCNRKYIVNLSKVSMLRKENEGYILDLCNESIPPLPVTKTYVDLVLGYFTEQQPLLDPME